MKAGKNVIANHEATSLVVRGIEQNDDLAKQALGQISPVSKYNNPQRIVTATHNGFNRIYRLKRYYNPDSDKNVYDVIVTDSDIGKLVTKIARENKSGKREFEKILNERADLQVAEGARGLGQAGQTPIPNTARDKIINNYSLFVNCSLPNVSEVYKGAGDAAAGMKQAISQGLDKIKPLTYKSFILCRSGVS